MCLCCVADTCLRGADVLPHLGLAIDHDDNPSVIWRFAEFVIAALNMECMMRKPLLMMFSASVFALALAGCPGETPDPDGGEPEAPADSGEPEAPVDSGEPEAPVDSGEPEAPVDSGEPEAPVDSGEPEVPTDGGEEPTDGGEEPTDGGEEPTDGGEEPTDGGEEPTDGGEEPTDGGNVDPTDGGEEPTDGGNVDPTDGGEPIDGGEPTDGGAMNTATIADLLAAPEGAVDMLVENVYVTYVRTIGFTIQADPTGPAIFVFDTSHTLAVGNMVSLHVTEVGSYQGMPQVTAHTVAANDMGAYDVAANLAQELVDVPGPDTLAELVKVTGTTSSAGEGNEWTIALPGGVLEATLYTFNNQNGLCAGATFDIVSAYISVSNGEYTIRSYEAADITNVNTDNCAQATVVGTWDFEDWTGMPPAGFDVEASGEVIMVEETTNVGAAGGTSSAAVLWTTQAQASTDIVATVTYPITEGQTATCATDYYDNDIAGRVCLNVVLGGNGHYQGSCSVDADAWQTMEHSAVAAAGETTFTCAYRFYDVSANWDGDAEVYLDNLVASITD